MGGALAAPWGQPPIDAGARLAHASRPVVRLLIFIQPPRHVAPVEAESWLEGELGALRRNGVDSIQLRRLRAASRRFSETCAWMIELDCRSAEDACAAVDEGPGLMLLGDLRMLGMHPCVALVEDTD